jgi:hypothetical protein
MESFKTATVEPVGTGSCSSSIRRRGRTPEG